MRKSMRLQSRKDSKTGSEFDVDSALVSLHKQLQRIANKYTGQNNSS
jgi:hypothetical protein